MAWALAINNPLTTIRAGLPFDWTGTLPYVALAVLGVLMLLGVFFKGAFHALALVVLGSGVALLVLSIIDASYASFATLNILLMILPLENLFQFSYELPWLKPLINLLFWFLPFAIYYFIGWRRRRSLGR